MRLTVTSENNEVEHEVAKRLATNPGADAYNKNTMTLGMRVWVDVVFSSLQKRGRSRGRQTEYHTKNCNPKNQKSGKKTAGCSGSVRVGYPRLGVEIRLC